MVTSSKPTLFALLALAAMFTSACTTTEVSGTDSDVAAPANDPAQVNNWGTDPNTGQSTEDVNAASGEDGQGGTTTNPSEADGQNGDAGSSTGSDSTGPSGPAPGEFLHPCNGNDECYSGYCVGSPDGDVCSKTCSDDGSCPPNWSCASVTEGGDPTFICVPNDTFLCRPCESDDDCNLQGYPVTGVCLQVGGQGAFCTRKCDTKACSEGFTCQSMTPYGPDTPPIELCAADSPDACTCTPKFVDEHAVTGCFRENEFGTCHGNTMCLEVGPLPECSAPVPAGEICNGIDDDCDGETDEDALDCTTYYLDTDGDGYGLGLGTCFCEKPGDAWLLQGGDCNEQVMSINPGAPEVCGNFQDDDCDGEFDEENAVGCFEHYFDQDGDGYGISEQTACLCGGVEGWAPEPGDCNDLNPGANPGITEVCDTIDNDCDTKVDEEGAINCAPFWHDSDGDGYGLTDQYKCLCGPTGVFIGNKDNDCDDTTTAVNPGVPELCNGTDDNCDGITDEGDSMSMCPQVASGIAECVDGSCTLTSCDDGWSDADGDPLNGCECPIGQLEIPGGAGGSCLEPQELGVLSDSGTATQVTDNIAPATDVDWYKFTALDGADPNSCDSFDVRVSFVHNPQGRFAFDVFEGGCESSKEICKAVSLYTNTTNISTQIGETLVGECPCAIPQIPPNAESEDDGMVEGNQHCSDNTNVYYVKVYRRDEFEPSCAAYTLAITNGPI